MAKVVQAKCPHCKHVLRIPGEWLNQPMRCKNCQKTFQAKAKSAPPVPAAAAANIKPANNIPAPIPPAANIKPADNVPSPVLLAPGAPPAQDSFDFNAAAPPPATPIVYSKRGSRRWIGIVVGLAIVLVAAACLVVAGPFLMELAKNKPEKKSHSHGSVKISKLDGTNSDTPPSSADTIRVNPDKTNSAKTGTPKSNNTGGNKKKHPAPTKKTGNRRPRTGKSGKGYFPRRALAISVNDYLLANPLNYGRDYEGRFPGSSTHAVLYWLSHGFRMKFPKSQLTELSDYSLKGDAPLKSVIENTVKEFVDTSRPQDRIMLLFSGHAVEMDDQAYLIPIEGDRDDPKTLVPISWVYKQLESCPARQKIFIVDVCRYDPGRGLERDGGDPMGEVLEKQLKNPPAGVQVWSSCSKEQQSLEFENGSLFMEALCFAMWKRLEGIQHPPDPIPLDQLVTRVNEYLQQRLAKTEWKQTTFVAGSTPANGAPYDPSEPLPPIVRIEPPMLSGGAAGRAVVKSILDEINSAPPPRVNRARPTGRLRFGALPPFPADVLANYQADGYTDEMEFVKEKDKFPLRCAIVKAKQIMQKNANTFRMKEYFDGPNNDRLKKQALNEEKKPGLSLFELEEALDEFMTAEKYVKKETSKRWKAHYWYVMARLKSRLIYILEYETALAKIRTDSLPPLENGATGYRLASRKRPSSREGKSRAWRADVKDLWNKIVDDYPDTPWSLLARRERATNLGLEWRATRQ